MGQARQRGTFEQRKKLAIEKEQKLGKTLKAALAEREATSPTRRRMRRDKSILFASLAASMILMQK